MASQNPKNPKNLYPEVIQSNPDSAPLFSSSSSSSSPSAPSLYPSLDMKDLAENLFPDSDQSFEQQQPTCFESSEEVVIKIPGSIVHLIDKEQSVELASGVLEIVRLRQGNNVVAVLARIGDEIQWPLAKDEAAVKLDGSHYFFTLRVPSETDTKSGTGVEPDNLLNYGLTVTGKGTEKVLEEFDRVLEEYSAFSVKEVERSVAVAVEDGGSSEAKAAAYWTTLAPNVEDYSGSVARMIASGSGQLIRGILWCGDVTVDRLKWGNEFLKKRMKSGSKEVSPEALKRMKSMSGFYVEGRLLAVVEGGDGSGLIAVVLDFWLGGEERGGGRKEGRGLFDL